MKALRYISILLVGLLTSCSTSGLSPRLETLAYPGFLLNLKGLVPPHPPLYVAAQSAERNPNCPVNEFNMPGQGFRINGSTGGLSYASFTHLNKTPFAVGQGVRLSFFTSPLSNDKASIIVADDFGSTWWRPGAVYALGSAVFTQKTLDAKTLKMLLDSKQLSHGALVFTHMQEAIQGTGLYILDTAASSASKKVYRRVGNRTITLTVLAVNTQLKNTQIISSKIQTAIDGLGSDKGRATVVNMSFGLMPCKVYEDYRGWEALEPDFQTFEDYMIALADFNSANYGQLVNAVIESTNLANDPLRRLIAGQSGAQYGTGLNIYVGAAGNYGLNRSMYPANWTNVVNVTGSSLDNPSRRATEFFSRGEVMHAGASLRLDPPRGLSSGKPIYYLGTSYSTPTVSAYSVLDVALTRRCAELGMNPVSELGKEVMPLVDRPLETIGAVPGAVSKRCGAN